SLLIVSIALAGCAGKGGSGPPSGDDAGLLPDAGVDMATTFDAGKKDGPAQDAACGAGTGARKVNGAACGCAAECASNFCVEGVCCDSAGTSGCKSCALPDTLGTCTSLAASSKPRFASQCPVGDPTNCGLDGTCDGAGACRKYSASTVCRAGTCDGDTSINAY